MATETSDLLTRAAPRAVAVIRGIADDQLDLPTPCRDYTVRDLANHLFQVVVNFPALAAKEPVEWADKPDFLADGWRDRFEAECGGLIDAWSEPSAEEGVSSGMGLPQTTVGTMALLDLTVHAWDLARATGQPFAAEPTVVGVLHGLVEQMGPRARAMGVFGAAVPAGPDATEFDRLLCAAGRDPKWTPPAEPH
ncbi:MAG TPA: TIGR03086 family metal-binding protein [Micromonosporaceae bacterium]